MPGANFYAADCSLAAGDIAFLQEPLATGTDGGIAVTNCEIEMSVRVPSMETGYVTSTTEPLAIIIRTGRTLISDSDGIAP